MTKKTLHITPNKHEIIDGSIKRSCDISLYDGDELINNKELWFKFPEIKNYPDDDDCDAYLLAMIMEAMQENRAVIIHGSASAELLSNLEEFQSAWNKWLPDTYNIIDIVVDNVRKNETRMDGAVCAFSGGVDATFSVWRHTQKKNGHRSQNIKFCALVHGFDISP